MVAQVALDEFHCPYCGSSLELEDGFNDESQSGIVRCSCYRYPIIEGILILKQLSGPADSRDRRVEYLEGGDLKGALRHALYKSSPILPPPASLKQPNQNILSRFNRIFSRITGHSEASSAVRGISGEDVNFRETLLRLRPGGYADYLFHRYANNSFLASIPLLLMLKELCSENFLPSPRPIYKSQKANGDNSKTDRRHTRSAPRVLDFASGLGHASFLMASLFPQLSIVAADHDFVNLYIARRHLIPNVTCVCVDAEIPLPFASQSFDAVFCLDGFHYIRSKVALLSELERIVHDRGLWLFPHLHNAAAENISPGIPLSYDDYARCFNFSPMRIFSEAAVFRDLMLHQCLDLSEAPAAAVRASSVFTLIASRRETLWRRHENITDPLWKNAGPLSVNPIYRASEQRNAMRLQMAWPNADFEAECAPIKPYLPQECEIDRSLWQRIKTCSIAAQDEPSIRELVNSFVLVRLPQSYGALA